MRFHIYSTERTNEVIRRVRLWSDTTRPKVEAGGGYVVRVGVAEGDKTYWLGEWNQWNRTLMEREHLELTGIPDINFPLKVGQVCVIEVLQQGAPGQGTLGMCVEWKFARYGNVGDTEVAGRIDSEEFPGARKTYPLFSLGKHIDDNEVRAAVTPLEETLNTSGVTEWVLSTPIPQIGGSGFEEAFYHEEANKSVHVSGPTGFIALPTLPVVTLTPPDPAIPYRAHISAGFDVTASAPGPTYAEFYLFDNTQGRFVAPVPNGPARGVKVGTAGAAPGTDFGAGSVHSHGYTIPAGTGPVQIQMFFQSPPGNVEIHDPWLNAVLYRDPYVV
jgi:hypothetical protein